MQIVIYTVGKNRCQKRSLLTPALFSARQHICYSALYAIARPSVRPSVRLSVTRVDQSKTIDVRITQPLPQSSNFQPISRRISETVQDRANVTINHSINDSSFLTPNVTAKFQREDRDGAPNDTGVGKTRNFQPISRRISETVQDRANVTINH